MSSEDLDQTAYDCARSDELTWEMSKPDGLSRRRFLELAGLTVGAGALTGACRGGDTAESTAQPVPEAPLVKPTPPDRFIVTNELGHNAEMRWEQMAHRGYVVPNDLFFIRQSGRTPRIDVKNWRLTVSGTGVERPVELTYDQLLAIPAVRSVTRFIECAGNGRRFFKEVSGQETYAIKDGQRVEIPQWGLGAVGVAEWTGVPLGAVLERAGLKKSARDVMHQGVDEPKVRRPIPRSKALHDDTLLVFAMNGEPLPPDHGFPVRALVPGWVGNANVKWVGHIEVSEETLHVPLNTAFYVYIGPGYPAEEHRPGPEVTSMATKSALELPWPARLPAGGNTIRGRSWSASGRIAKVEISLDGGRTWAVARLSDPNEPMAWVRWTFHWQAAPGEHTIKVRATDERGNTQPDAVPFNLQGYNYHAVAAHPVTVA